MIELAVLIHAGFLKGAPLLWATLGAHTVSVPV